MGLDDGSWDFKISARDNIVTIAISAPSDQQAEQLFYLISEDIVKNNRIQLEIVGEKTIIRNDRRGTLLQ